MADDVTRDFIPGQFRQVRGEFAGVDERLDRLQRGVGTVEDLVADLVSDRFGRRPGFSARDARLRRVGARLESRDA